MGVRSRRAASFVAPGVAHRGTPDLAPGIAQGVVAATLAVAVAGLGLWAGCGPAAAAGPAHAAHAVHAAHAATTTTTAAPPSVAPPAPTAARPSRRALAATALSAVEASVDLDGAVVGRAAGPTIVVVFASWCGHCHDALARLAALRAARPDLRVLGVNYRGHETYEQRGGPAAVRRLVAERAPWLRVVPADDALFARLGAPPKIPTLYVYGADGELRALFDRSERPAPDDAELAAALPPP